MTIKLFEIRDRGTTMPMMAIKLEGEQTAAEQWLLERAGYYGPHQAQYVLLLDLAGDATPPGRFTSDPYGWRTPARTIPIAHQHIAEHFDTLETGAVVDVEYILGLRGEPKVSDRFWQPETS